MGQPGSTAVVEFHAIVPGVYELVDNSAAHQEKGAVGMIRYCLKHMWVYFQLFIIFDWCFVAIYLNKSVSLAKIVRTFTILMKVSNLFGGKTNKNIRPYSGVYQVIYYINVLLTI